MRKLSFGIWLFIALVWAFNQFTNALQADISPSQASATIAGMANIGVYEAIAGFIMLALFPLVTLAYLLNWQHLFTFIQTSKRLSKRTSKRRMFEAIIFLMPALVIAWAWLNKVYSANAFIQLLALLGTLPLVIFAVINVINYCQLPAQSINRLRKGELVFFTLPVLCLCLFFGIGFYQTQIRAQQDVVMAKAACEDAFTATVTHQINRQKDEIIQSASLQHTQYYKNLPKK